ncbi:thiamine pyrophosphate-dependent enzyme [uncultured Paludibaculum sp.]|uniref:thiamine pyrophosphate-dependent enzyme n=1 Tax=uncultured Paludibaculum sp. TaxID=1765020 RepID=UPI002AAB606D|nr:thiamine pyrophosphate-dependent enzyme [uncultured Paludibaculum sp.]
MNHPTAPLRRILSGDEAVALAAFNAHLTLGTGYPGTPSTEILESLHSLGGRAQWSPNEKVALEVGIGVAFGGGRALVTMKHVGLNVAADPLFTVAYTGVRGALVIVSADDPGMASSQNEQDNRRYAVAAGIPMLEPADSQEAYNFTLLAIEVSERWSIPVLLRMTTRVCHSKTIVETPAYPVPPAPPAGYVRDVPARVMIPAYARPAHHKLRAKLAQIAEWNEREGPLVMVPGSDALGVITSGVSFQYVREALPQASVLKLGMTYPLPHEVMRNFAASHARTLVIEEGDPYLADAARSAGIPVEASAEMFRFGELNVARVRRMEAGDLSPEPKPAPGKPPELCHGCPHRTVFTALRDLGCIVSGDIGCYSLGVLPPFLAIDTLVCMGASIGVGLGLRHTLPDDEARRVVSVIGDSTFVHSGITGLVEMVYNPPPTGHLVLILDNGTTAMTGLQEHPGTGRTLDHASTGKFIFEDVIRAMGIQDVHVIDPTRDPTAFTTLVKTSLDSGKLSVIIARRNCLLAAGAIRQYEKCPEGGTHE